MSNEERAAALEAEAIDYADAKARAGIWTHEESAARARAEIQGLVGARPTERGHEFYVALDGSGQRVGWLWIGPVPSEGASADARWLFQIVVDAPLRGRGLGRALLRAAEERVLASGRAELALNVFRWNTVAVALYRSSGYDIAFQDDKALEMRKRLRPS